MMLKIENCRVCPQNCGVNRYVELGYCRAGAKVKINSHQLHYGEEPNLSGLKGSGTIFFSHCNMRCVYCQNFTISHFAWGREVENEELAEMMLDLERKGAHNINLVSPTHYTPQIIEAIRVAKDRGLSVPIVWNSNAYEKVETLRLLEGLVDIYLPDFRYFSDQAAAKYSEVDDYSQVATEAIKEMYRQVGHIQEVDGVAVSGLMIRILVLPEDVGESKKTLEWIFNNLGNETYLSVMAQYYPTYLSSTYSELDKRLTIDDYDIILEALNSYGFEKGYVQDKG
ncbi:MAG: radical SAM protein [Candidatus Cloacimonadia bacterium]